MTQAFNLSRIAGNLNTSGQLDATDGLNGVLPIANGGTGSSTAAFSGANITGLNATNISSGVLAVANGGTGSSTAAFSGANITGLDATNISAGTLAVARGGTGAATLDANNVILGNGTSAVQFVAPGTNGNVLTSNGTTWTSAAAGGGGGSFVYLASATASASVVDFTGLDTSTYFSFLITFTDVRGSAFSCRLYPGGTLSTAAQYAYAYVYADASGSAGSGASGQTVLTLSTTNTTTANIGITGYLQFFPAGGYSSIVSNFTVIGSTGGSITNFSTCGSIMNATAANGIRFGGASMGNLTGGNFKLYGLKAS
jgi:hypothetical protein